MEWNFFLVSPLGTRPRHRAEVKELPESSLEESPYEARETWQVNVLVLANRRKVSYVPSIDLNRIVGGPLKESLVPIVVRDTSVIIIR